MKDGKKDELVVLCSIGDELEWGFEVVKEGMYI